MPPAVLSRLRNKLEERRRKHVIPEGLRIYAVGDVHGCLDQLQRVLDAIAKDLARRTVRSKLIFIGDMIDRGPDSAGVIDRVLNGNLPTDEAVFLMGNHEEAMLACVDGH